MTGQPSTRGAVPKVCARPACGVGTNVSPAARAPVRIDGATLVDLYDEKLFVPTAVAELVDFFATHLSAGP
jgi:hypothetical protein